MTYSIKAQGIIIGSAQSHNDKVLNSIAFRVN